MNKASGSARYECPDCGAAIRAPAEAIGKRAKCPKCATAFVLRSNKPVKTKTGLATSAISHSASAAKSSLHQNRPTRTATSRGGTTRQKVREQILGAFHGDFPHPRLSLGMRLTALFVVCVMLLLPLAYLAFATSIGWFTYWHATHNYTWMAIPGGRAKVFVGLIYVMLIIMGTVWFFSLLGNLFVRLGSGDRAEGLKREEEPLLYEFAEKLADVIGAPRPDAIRLCLNSNASASYETSLFGLRRKAFVLTIGIPLVSGLTLPQLTGVIAHEFGHFSQRGSTLLTQLIYRINVWFAAAAAGGDATDSMIYGMTEDEDTSAGVALIGFLFWILVNLGRAVLWCLMMFGIAVSSTLSRRMEFDADRYEAGVVGSQTFKSTSRRLVELNVAEAVAGELIGGSLDADHLPDNFPAFVSGLADRYPRVRKTAKKIVRDEKTSFFSSHPTTNARIRAIEKLDLPGIFQSVHPAKVLFRQFDKESRQLTQFLYSLQFRRPVDEDRLRSTEEALKVYMETMS